MSAVDVEKSNDAGPTLDRLAGVMERFHVHAALFHAGPLCGLHVFEERPGRAFLHVLRRGAMEMRHQAEGRWITTAITEPSLLLFTRAVHHAFVNPPVDGPDFTCATLDFDGGPRHPIVQALPPVLVIPLSAVEGLTPTLDLLFAEAAQVSCGSVLVANRLFEVLLIKLLRWMLAQPSRAGVPQGLMLGLSDPRLARALVALHARPQEAWPLERLAQVAGMSRSAFAAAFKDAVGSTPAAYVLDWRLALAGALVREGRPIKQIALDLGFADAPTLSKAFRRRLGVSPRGWLAGTEPATGTTIARTGAVSGGKR